MATKRIRDKNLNVRASAAEMKMLAAVADAMGLSGSDVVRQLIRQAYAEKVTAKAKR